MRFLLVLSIAGMALAAGALVERVKAEQAFLCEGGRIVYARGEEVEKLKLTDACVAGYFGTSILRGANGVSSPGPAAAPAPVPGGKAAAKTALDGSAAASTAGVTAAAGKPEFTILNARPAEDAGRRTSR